MVLKVAISDIGANESVEAVEALENHNMSVTYVTPRQLVMAFSYDKSEDGVYKVLETCSKYRHITAEIIDNGCVMDLHDIDDTEWRSKLP